MLVLFRDETFVLIKPVNPLFQFVNERVDEDAWGDLIVALLLLIIVDMQLHNPWYITIMFIFISLFTSLIFLGLAVLGNIVSLLSNGLGDLAETTFDFFDMSKYPLAIYSSVLRIIMTFILPIGWVASIPQEKIAVSSCRVCILFYPNLSVMASIFTKIPKYWQLILKSPVAIATGLLF